MSLTHKNSFTKEELIDCGHGRLFGPGNPRLPVDNMLMLDRITHISGEGGEYGKGQLVAPDLSLSGKIIQRNNKINRRKTQVDYYFQMTLTDINTGLAFWEDEVPIIKRGSSKSVTW